MPATIGMPKSCSPLSFLCSIFSRPAEAQTLAEACVVNGQIWNASLCQSKYLPAFIKALGPNLKAETLRALQYQVEHSKWYPGDSEASA